MTSWRTSGMWKFGIGFWTGAGVYSLINMIMNYKHAAQDQILNYNYIIMAVAIFGLILNITMHNKKKTEEARAAALAKRKNG